MTAVIVQAAIQVLGDLSSAPMAADGAVTREVKVTVASTGACKVLGVLDARRCVAHLDIKARTKASTNAREIAEALRAVAAMFPGWAVRSCTDAGEMTLEHAYGPPFAGDVEL